jgi:AcrR family transcriptional regulator
MSSLRHTRLATGAGDDALLDAARASIVAVGWRRSTLTDVARRAGVSRMTLYRRWPDMATLVADLMAREWSGLGAGHEPATDGPARPRLAAAVAAGVRALRSSELFAKILEVDPELLLPYLLRRRGRTQDALIHDLVAGVSAGQADGSVRPGDPVLLARSVLLAAYGFALSVPTMTDAERDDEAYDGELRALVDGYLAP